MLTRHDFDDGSLSSFPLQVEEVVSKKRFVVSCVEEIPDSVEIKVLKINYMEGNTNVSPIKKT